MNDLQTAFNAEIGKLPDILLRDLLAKKLTEGGADYDAGLIERLIEHLHKSDDERFEYDNDGPDISLDITFGEKDISSIEQATADFIENLPNLIQDISESSAKAMLRRFKQDWSDFRPHENLQFNQFRENLRGRWGKAIDLSRMLLHVSIDTGEAFQRRLSRSKAKKNRALKSVLCRLHLRSCQVMSEIICLLENGYADGAMARWRTLYELSAVATVISDGGDDLAERYAAHDAVEAKRELDVFIKHHEELGYAPPTKQAVKHTDQMFNHVISQYGKEFGKPHGWAVGFLGINNSDPKFSDIEAAAGRSSMRSYYKMASYNVHASPRGLRRRIGTIDQMDLLIAGATNAGIEEPGQNAVFSLTQITCLLFRPNHKLDDLVTMRGIVMLRDKAVDEFHKAAKKLKRDDRAAKWQP